MSKITEQSMKHQYDGQYVTFVKKNNDYGNSFEQSLNRYGIVASIVRMQDKMNRIESLTSGDKTPEVRSESLVDTLEDLSNYSAMTACWLKGIRDEDPKESPSEGLLNSLKEPPKEVVCEVDPRVLKLGNISTPDITSGIIGIRDKYGRDIKKIPPVTPEYRERLEKLTKKYGLNFFDIESGMGDYDKVFDFLENFNLPVHDHNVVDIIKDERVLVNTPIFSYVDDIGRLYLFGPGLHNGDTGNTNWGVIVLRNPEYIDSKRTLYTAIDGNYTVGVTNIDTVVEIVRDTIFDYRTNKQRYPMKAIKRLRQYEDVCVDLTNDDIMRILVDSWNRVVYDIRYMSVNYVEHSGFEWRLRNYSHTPFCMVNSPYRYISDYFDPEFKW